MKTLSVKEIREQLSNIEALAAAEGEILLTRRGRPIARILPLGRSRRMPSRRALREKMPYTELPSEELIRAERDER